jgi:hypothetical protein
LGRTRRRYREGSIPKDIYLSVKDRLEE